VVSAYLMSDPAKQAWQQLLVATYVAVGQDFGTITAKELDPYTSAKLWVPSKRKDDYDVDMDPDLEDLYDEDPWLEDVVDYILGPVGLSKVSDITDTTRDQVAQVVAAAVEAGLGMDDIAASISSLYVGLGSRATMIARTETVAASNCASQQYALGTGLTLVAGNRGITYSRDPRCRRWAAASTHGSV
jgi:hypothetical protein